MSKNGTGMFCLNIITRLVLCVVMCIWLVLLYAKDVGYQPGTVFL